MPSSNCPSLFGAVSSSRALILARWAKALSGKAIVVCPNDDTAEELARDLEALSMLEGGDPLPVFHFPTWEHTPYSSIALSIRTRHQRIAGLSFLLTNRGPGVLVASMEAAVQACAPKSAFMESALTLKINDSVGSREAFIQRLTQSGYWRTDPVEDPGTFAVRGDIVDIFPPDRPRPLRIELFDDLLERIREFEPTTQRAVGANSFPSVWIPPAREIAFHSNTVPLLKERLKAQADDQGVSRALRDPLVESVVSGIYPDHADAWAPFAFSRTGSLLGYLDDGGPVAVDDPEGCADEIGRFLEEQRELFDKSAREIVVPPPAALYLWNDDFRAQLGNLTALRFTRTESADGKTLKILRSSESFPTGGAHPVDEVAPELLRRIREGFKAAVFCQTQSQRDRVKFLLTSKGLTCTDGGPLQAGFVHLFASGISGGFVYTEEGLIVLSEAELLGSRAHKRAKTESRKTTVAEDWSGLQNLTDLSAGDLIVHVDHGIGRYLGLVRLDLLGAPSDYIQIEYAGKDKLYIPVYRLNVIQKYMGGSDNASLDKLGGQQFEKTKQKVRDAVRKLAFDLVDLYAKRKLQAAEPFAPRDAEYREFEGKFPYNETPDQLKAIEAVISDMESGQVMDRLVCGDVGYGKTEVAIRAAFLAVTNGKQVAVLVPTTVLAQQHEESFRSRLKDYPFRIESVSRFKSTKEQKAVLADAAAGKVDILIGTHRLLSRDVKFHDLGLIVVDEEHRFGVEHKEKLKTLRINTHVLTLTATPIPRTLHMALSGLREISLITTPPVDRLPIRTFVSKYDEEAVRQAVEFELARGGQVFLVHNRVQDIYEIAGRLQELAPKAQVAVGHGQMGEGELEEAMLSFYTKKANVLVCTTIIESGLDIPSANTMIIDAAENYGLAQLYQIRGRVGRSDQRAYAYLFVASEGGLSETARRRLETIQRFVELGSGFNIASHDLEIRGGGNLLGPEQSGHIAAVGFDLYTELLEEAIQELQGKPLHEDMHREPEIKAPFPAYLDEKYIPDLHQKLSFYRRFSAAREESGLLALEEELTDRYGAPPPEALNLIWFIRIKNLLRRSGIDTLIVGPEKVSLIPGKQSRLDPQKTIRLITLEPKKYSLTPDSKLVATLPTGVIKDLYFSLESLLNRLLTL